MVCLVCDKHAAATPSEIIWSDELFWVGHMPADPSVYRGWLLVESARHVAGFEDRDDAEAAAVGTLSSRVARALRSIGAEHVYALRFGDGVPHFHLHLVPRYPDTPREFWGMRLEDWPDGPRVDERQRRLLIDELRQTLRSA